MTLAICRIVCRVRCRVFEPTRQRPGLQNERLGGQMSGLSGFIRSRGLLRIRFLCASRHHLLHPVHTIGLE
jgi:hypothetical protein